MHKKGGKKREVLSIPVKRRQKIFEKKRRNATLLSGKVTQECPPPPLHVIRCISQLLISERKKRKKKGMLPHLPLSTSIMQPTPSVGCWGILMIRRGGGGSFDESCFWSVGCPGCMLQCAMGINKEGKGGRRGRKREQCNYCTLIREIYER